MPERARASSGSPFRGVNRRAMNATRRRPRPPGRHVLRKPTLRTSLRWTAKPRTCRGPRITPWTGWHCTSPIGR